MKLKPMEERFLKSTYLDKGTDLSVTSLTKPDYQLWVTANAPKVDKKQTLVGFKSAIGSAWHEFCEKANEPGVVKEMSFIKEHKGISIGGTADELVFLPEIGKWQIRDHKTKGVYSAKKFLGIGSAKAPAPMPENEKEILQLSIYRWLFKEMFDCDDEAVIYLWVMGHTAREKFPEVSEVPLKLKPLKEVEAHINHKLKIMKQKEEPEVDCDTKWLCNYCEVAEFCPKQKHLHDPFGGN